MAGWGSRSILFLSSPLRSARSFFPAAAAAATVVRGFGFSTCAVQPHLERVGFIGLGNMGFHMANNLINAGYKVTVHDINHNALKKFVEKGIPTKETPFDIAKTSDVVITMLPSSTHVLDVYTGTNGLLHGESPLQPWLFIDSSTVDPLTSRRVSKEIGGPEEAFHSSRPLFLSMGRRAIYCGANGNGAAAKICNNLAMAVSMVGVSEAFALGQHLGMTASTLTDIFNSSSARCWSSDSYNPVPGVMGAVPSSRDYTGGFSSKLMAKDLALAIASAEEVGLNCPLSFKVREIYMDLCKEGYESDDFSCVFRHYYSGKDES